jgi:homoserine kinase
VAGGPLHHTRLRRQTSPAQGSHPDITAAAVMSGWVLNWMGGMCSFVMVHMKFHASFVTADMKFHASFVMAHMKFHASFVMAHMKFHALFVMAAAYALSGAGPEIILFFSFAILSVATVCSASRP